MDLTFTAAAFFDFRRLHIRLQWLTRRPSRPGVRDGVNPGSGQGVSVRVAGAAAEQRPIRHWPSPLWVAGVSALAILAIFHQTGASFLQSWDSSRTFAHGFFVLPVFLYLIWIRRERISWQRARPQFWGLPLLLSCGLVWSLGALADTRVIQQFAVVGMLITTIWTVLGTDVVRAMRFPLAFLFFAVPFGENIVGALQDFTAWFAVTALRLTNVPSILENRTIYLPSGAWSVAEACSGIRYLISSIVLGLVFASLAYRSWKRRLAFMIAAIVVPIVGNGFRAYGIILLGYLSNNRLAVGVDHIVYGFVFFVLLELALMLVGLKWRQPPDTGSSPSSSAGTFLRQGFHPVGPLVAAICAVFLVGWMPLAARHFSVHSTVTSSGPQQLPSVSPPWRPVLGFDDQWTPNLHANRQTRQSYAAGEEQVDVYLAGYDQDRLELVEGYNLSREPHVWFGGTSQLWDTVIDGKHITVQQRLLRSTSSSRVVWIWYWVGDQFTANAEKVKLLQLENRLLHRSEAAGVIVLSVDYQDDLAGAQRSLEAFLGHASMQAAFRNSLPR